KLIFAIECQDVEGVIEAIRDGAEVDKEVIDNAYAFLESLEMEYADDKALYAGRTAKNSDQDYIYRIVTRYAKGQKLDTIINTMFNRKTNPLKSKGEIITPKNKRELIKLMNKKRQYLGDIDISNIKDFSELFTDVIRTDFGGIELWDTSHVVNMNRMFEKFNFSEIKSDSPLFDWISNMDTSNVSDMGYMFSQSIGFNTDIGSWNTSNVLNMSYMFLEAEDFNQDISSWDTSNVLCMVNMFHGAKSFKQNIDNWDVSSINKDYRTTNAKKYKFIDHENLCNYALYENCPTKPKWLMPCKKENGKYKPNTKLELILLAKDKNINLADVDISNINDLSLIFLHCERDFSGIESWNTSHVVNMSNMFAYSNMNQDIGMWDTSKVAYMDGMFQNTPFNQNINNWNISNVKDLSSMFYCAEDFNQPLDKWDTSRVESMYNMFCRALKFNQDIGLWNTSKVKDMSDMFAIAKSFNQNINNWNVSNVKNMSYMFAGTEKFNQPLDKWNTGKVTNMNSMFRRSKRFNQNISSWNVSHVKNFIYMFKETEDFNQSLNGWDITGTTSLAYMFSEAKSFNSPLNEWDTSKIKDMTGMFAETEKFNQPLSDWDVSNVTEMYSMFRKALSFNQDLSNWNLKSIRTLEHFLYAAKSYTYSLKSWRLKYDNVRKGSMVNDTNIEGPTWY
ncbi:TPA: DUF285 domain-containing protein, partial [Campylobacter coli]|nr:DUF285 domain-containing protein [Campylobacter coli]